MADKFIRDLASALSLSPTAVVAVDQGGNAQKATMVQLRNLCDGDAETLHLFEHFVMGTVALPAWLVRSVGSTLSATYSAASAASGSAFGRIYAYPNGACTGFGFFNQTSIGCLRPEAKVCEIVTRLQIASASDATNLWSFGGFIDNVTPAATEPQNGVYFKASHNATIKLIARSGGVETALDTGQSFVSDGDYRTIKIRYTSTEARIFIDGVDYGAITTNIPIVRCYAWWITQRAGAGYPACAWDFVQLDMY